MDATRKFLAFICLISLALLVCCGGSSSNGSDDSAQDDGEQLNDDVSPTFPGDWDSTSEATYQDAPANCLFDLVTSVVTGPPLSECVPEPASCASKSYFTGGGHINYYFEDIDPEMVSLAGYDPDNTLIFTMDTVSTAGTYYHNFVDAREIAYQLRYGPGLQELTVVCPDGSQAVFSVESDSNPALTWLNTMRDLYFDCMLELMTQEEFASCFNPTE